MLKPFSSPSFALAGLLLGVLWVGTLPGLAQGKAPAGKTVAQNLVDGAVVLATMKFGGAPTDKENANNLLRFALKLDPENEKALLLQGKVERGLPLDKVELTDGGEQYVRYLVKTANGCKPESPKRLLLLKVVEFLKPGNEQSLLELTKAKNNGIDVSFDWLLDNMDEGTAKAEGNLAKARGQFTADFSHCYWHGQSVPSFDFGPVIVRTGETTTAVSSDGTSYSLTLSANAVTLTLAQENRGSARRSNYVRRGAEARRYVGTYTWNDTPQKGAKGYVLLQPTMAK